MPHTPARHRFALAICAAVVVPACAGTNDLSSSASAVRGGSHGGSVHALFDLSSPDRSPFPSDRFTVADQDQNTGRRVALPMPTDCVANASDCHDVTFLNRLDGFYGTPRISIPFDGDIDVSTATSENIFLVSLGDALAAGGTDDSDDGDAVLPNASIGRIIGINQVVWDPATHTLFARSDEALDEHSRYALVVTRGVHDAAGNPIGRSEEFDRYRGELAGSDDSNTRWYRRALLTAEWAARGAGVQNQDIAAVSMFSTQSATYLVEQVRTQVRAGAAPVAADFNVGPGGTRAVFAANTIRSMTFNRQTRTTGALSPLAVDLTGFNLSPGSVGTVAFGRFQSADFMVHPGEYIPETATRTGAPAVQRINSLYFNITLPAGAMPAGGWPVVIYGHGTDRDKSQAFVSASILASRGFAVIAFNMVGHGLGANSTITVTRTNGTTAIVGAGGRGIDQNGDTLIGTHEGDSAVSPRDLQLNADAQVQNIADLMQINQVIQNGVDVDGDGQVDLNPDRTYYWGHSLGSMYGVGFFAYTPEVRAAYLASPGAPLFENRRLSPSSRQLVGQSLAARTPSLLNSASGLTSLAGVPVLAPFFNENTPLRNEPPRINNVPGAIAIQQFDERSVWISQRGNPAAFAPRLRLNPPAGVPARPFMFGFARSDTASPNPDTTAILRAGQMEDRAAYYRHDLFFAANPTAPKNPHGYPLQLNVPSFVPVVRDAQTALADFLASDGASFAPVGPTAVYWESPISSPLPETLNFIP